MSFKKRNFINLSELNKKDIIAILDRAKELKKKRNANKSAKTLKNINLAMIFEKPSTRTRVSFELAIKELGGESVILDESTTHLARGETIEDTARVLDRYCQIFLIRTTNHNKLLLYNQNAKAPIINGLSNLSHPCQILSDIMSFEEKRGSIYKKKITWMGDLNNVLYSWAEASRIFKFSLFVAHPKVVKLNKSLQILDKECKHITFTQDADIAAKDSDCLITDTWFSMGSKKDKLLEKHFLPYQINKNTLKAAKKNVVFMHCLPAKRGKEVTKDIIDDKKVSIVWDEAENRLHVQKAILEWCLKKI